jgi:2-dehydropantoate 2-reductase
MKPCPLDICVYGAGAIGGGIAARLAMAGENVCAVARGPHGAAIAASGLTLVSGPVRNTVRVPCFEAASQIAAPQDVVVVAVKGPALPSIAANLPGILKPGGLLVFAMNGIPWWFDQGMPVQLPDWLRAELDPNGILARVLAPQSIVGCVVQSSNEVVTPGVVLNTTPERNNLIMGKPDGTSGDLLERFVARLCAAGYQARLTSHIRDEIWTKTLLASSAGPVAALTGCSLDLLVANPQARSVLATIMHDGTVIGRALGLRVNEDIEARLDFYRGKPVRPSMLQDFEMGRPAEVESSILVFAALASALGMDLPVVQTVAALSRMKKQSAGTASPGE